MGICESRKSALRALPEGCRISSTVQPNDLALFETAPERDRSRRGG